MTDAYREAPSPTREEFAALEERMSAVEKRKPKAERAPFLVRLWHTMVGGAVFLGSAIYLLGWIYDHMPDCGTRISLFIVTALGGAASLITLIASFVQIDSKRESLSSPWRGDAADRR